MRNRTGSFFFFSFIGTQCLNKSIELDSLSVQDQSSYFCINVLFLKASCVLVRNLLVIVLAHTELLAKQSSEKGTWV